MNKHMRLLASVLGVIGGIGVGLGTAGAGTIPPVNPVTHLPISGSPVTVSIFQGGVDVTGTWLPEPGQTVNIVINGSGATPSLVPPPASFTFNGTTNPFLNANTMTTSAYPGMCTNFGSNTDLSPDFTLIGNNLTANDCGGMAVIQVGTQLFILPQDSNANGMPDVWENKYGGNLTPTADIETGPSTNALIGDGWFVFDEYRGAIVSMADPTPGFVISSTPPTKKHIRLDPTKKDFFIHLMNPQCTRTSTTPSLVSGGLLGTFPTTGTGGAEPAGTTFPLFTVSKGLGGATGNPVIHILGSEDPKTPASNGTTDQWVDNLLSYNPLTTPDFQYNAAGATADRRVNQNAVYPSPTYQKGVRLIECINDTVKSPLGVTIGSSVNPNSDTNSVIYTERIWIDFDSVTDPTKSVYTTCARASTCVYFQTPSGTTTQLVDRNFIVSKHIEWVAAHEAVGHSLNLLPPSDSTSSSYPHYVQGYGDVLDQRIVAKDSSKLKGILFVIPNTYNDHDNSSIQIK